MSVYKQTGTPFFVCDFTVGGRRIRRSTGKATKREALEVERQLRATAESRIGKDGRYNPTLDDACMRYLDEHASSLSSSQVIEYQLQHAIDGIGGDTRLCELTDAMVADFVSLRRGHKVGKKAPRPLSPSTVNRELQMLSAVLNMARNRWGWEVGKFNFKAHRLREPAQRRRYLSPEEADALLHEAADHLKAPIEFSLLTGVRLDNCLSLTWRQVQFEMGEIRLMVKSKHDGGKPHTISMSAPCRALLTALDPRADGPVFVRDGQTIKTWRTAFKAACRRAGIEDFRWHDLRHTAATWMRRAGVPIETIKEVLAHEDIRTTMRYAHADHSETAAALDALGDMRSSAKKRAKRPTLVTRNR